MKAFVISRGDALTLITPYDPEFLESLKYSVPIPYRSYDPENRSWTIQEPYCKLALVILRTHFEDYEALMPFQAIKPPPTVRQHSPQDCLERVRAAFANYAELMVLPPVCGNDAHLHYKVVRAAYRAISAEVHPDKHGQSVEAKEHQQRVNQAFAAIPKVD